MRNLKNLGLALLEVLAVGMIAASVASANQFHSSVVNTTWTRSANETQEFQYETGGINVECVTVTGAAQTTAQTVPELTFNPTYTNCDLEEVPFSLVQINMNGCQYLFTLQATQNHGPVHIKCPPEEEITITVKVFGTDFCTVYIDEQTPNGNASWANSGAVEINVLPGQTGIVAERQGSAECGAAQSNTGRYLGKVQIRGEETGQAIQKVVQVG